MATLTPCPACGQPWDATKIPPPRVPLSIRCACCCQDGEGFPQQGMALGWQDMGSTSYPRGSGAWKREWDEEYRRVAAD